MKVNVLEAKNQLSQLIRRAQAGDEVVIANRGQPVARLVPARAPSAAGGPGDFAKWLADNPLPAHARRNAREIETGIEAERHGWD